MRGRVQARQGGAKIAQAAIGQQIRPAALHRPQPHPTHPAAGVAAQAGQPAQQGGAAVEDVQVVFGFKAFPLQDVKGNARALAHFANHRLRLGAEQRHINRVLAHQLGDELAPLHPANQLGLVVIQAKKHPAHRVPERRAAILAGDAQHLGHHGVGKARRVAGHEQQAAARQQLGRRPGAQFGQDKKRGQQRMAGEVVAQRQGVNLVVDAQLRRGVDQQLVAKTVKRLVIPSRSHQPRQTQQPAAGAVFHGKEIALFAIQPHLGGQRVLRGLNFMQQRFAVGRQRGDPHRALRRQRFHRR